MALEQERSNLEPIGDSDLDLRNKFSVDGAERKGTPAAPDMPGSSAEMPKAPETQAERKEGDAERDAAYARIMSKIPNASVAIPSRNDVASDAKEAEAMTDHASRIEKLVSLAETKGVAHAVKVARHLEDNCLLDELHDKLLASDLHDALVRKGMIREL